MGVDSCETEKSAKPDEKVDGHKQSSRCLPRCLLSRLRWSWKARKQVEEQQKIEQQKIEQQEIDQIRKRIDRNRKDLQENLDAWELQRDIWRRRGEAWRRGEDISLKEQRAGYFSFDTAYRYEMITEGSSLSKQTTILDFRTPEGREEALQWYEGRFDRNSKSRDRSCERYEEWENSCQEYLYMREKSQGRTKHTELRDVVLQGVPNLRWTVITANKLPN